MTAPDVQIRPFDRADTEAVVALWHDAGLVVPWNDPYRDIERKLTVQPDLFLVGEVPHARVRARQRVGKRLIPDVPAGGVVR